MQAYIEGKVRERLDTYFNVFLLFLRDIFLCQTLSDIQDLKNHDMESFIKKISVVWKTSDIEKRIALLDETRMRIMSYTNQKLTLDNFYLSLISC